MPTQDNITIFAFILMRMSGCVFLNPIVGRRNLPVIFKVALSLLLTLLIYSYSTPAEPQINSFFHYVALLLFELAVGLVIGFIITLFFYVISFGGEIIDMQMGLSMAKIYDPQSNISLSVTSTMFNTLMMFLFVSADGHVTLIRLFMASGGLIPYGQVAISGEVVTTVIEVFSQCTILAVKLAMPIIAIEMMTEVSVGIIMKVIPQINIFVVNVQAKILIGLVMISMLFVPFASFIENVLLGMFDTIDKVIVMFSPAV